MMHCSLFHVRSGYWCVGVSPDSWVQQWVRVHKARVRVRVHQGRVRVHQVRVRVHWTRVRVRVRVHWTRVRVRVQQKSECVRSWVQTQPGLMSPTVEKCFILTLLLINYAEWPCKLIIGSQPKFHSFFSFFFFFFFVQILRDELQEPCIGSNHNTV